MILVCVFFSFVLALGSTEVVYFEDITRQVTTSTPDADESSQDKLVLNLKRESGEEIQLQLKENRAINVNAPVYDVVYRNGVHRAVLRRESPTVEGVNNYYDLDKKAALQIRCEPLPNNRCFREITGVVDIDGETYDITPIPRHVFTRSHDPSKTPHLIQRSRVSDMNFDGITSNIDFPGGTEEPKRNVAQKRTEHKTYTVETIIALDPPLWRRFVERANNKYGTTVDEVVEGEARRYYTTVIHLASMAYEGINHPDFTIKIVISGFLFFKDLTQKMREAYNTDGTHIEGVHFGEFLSSIYAEMRENGGLVNADHVYTFTPSGAQGVAGANCYGCICRIDGWGWSVSGADELSYEARLVTHELGHGLGLSHISLNMYPDIECDPYDGYVMGSDIKGRFWEFSECSLREIQTYLQGTGQTCLLDTADVYNTDEWDSYTSKLPGEIRSITEQCVDMNNGKLFIDKESESVLCNEVTDPDFCYDMFCAGQDACSALVAADGTPCGLPSADKWCIAAECVSRTGHTIVPETTGDAEQCYKTFAETYMGTQSKTKSGYECKRWDSISTRTSDGFLDASVADAANYCRDPSVKGKPWCVLDAAWDYCDVPVCGPELESVCAEENRQYQKMLTQTRSGIPCQRWDSQTPQEHRFASNSDFPGETIADAANFCRPIDNEAIAWCYTTDKNKRWDYCDVKKCKDNTCHSEMIEYTGSINSTKAGLPCQYWDSNSPNRNNYKNRAEGNVCRSLDTVIPWCYLGRSWEYCDIPSCS